MFAEYFFRDRRLKIFSELNILKAPIAFTIGWAFINYLYVYKTLSFTHYFCSEHKYVMKSMSLVTDKQYCALFLILLILELFSYFFIYD